MIASSIWKSKIDIAIITIKSEEFRAVLDRFPDRKTLTGQRNYELAIVNSLSGVAYSVAVTRTLEQGQAEAQKTTQALIDDLDPRYIFVVGIAGGVPKPEFSLGDVILATRVNAFALSAVGPSGEATYQDTGGPMSDEVRAILSHLDAWSTTHLAGWNTTESIGYPRPNFSPPKSTSDPRLYGPDEWRKDTVSSLRRNFSKQRSPLFLAAPNASSNHLVKHVELVEQWQSSARQLSSIEMELQGVWMAARQKNSERPVFSIRGLSDIVGFRRSPEWTDYACHTAAAFAYQLINSGVLPPSGVHSGASPDAAGNINPSSQAESLGKATSRANISNFASIPTLPLHYVSRTDEVDRVRSLVCGDAAGQEGMRRGVGIVGMGGIGKTILAISVARNLSTQQYFPDGVFWVTVGPTPQVETKQAELLRMLTPATSSTAGERDSLTGNLRRALSQLKCLIILDDVWSPGDIAALAPIADSARLLLTTRDSSIIAASGIKSYQVDLLAKNDSIALLAAASGTSASALPECAEAICQMAGNLPLSLSMIGAHLRNKPLTRWNQTLERLRSGELNHIHASFPDYPYPSLLLAIQISIDSLERFTAELYSALAVMPAERPLPEDFLSCYWNTHSTMRSPAYASDIVDELVDKSLLRRDGHGYVYLHAIQREFIRFKTKAQSEKLNNILGKAILKLEEMTDGISCLPLLWDIQNSLSDYPFSVRYAALTAQRGIHVRNEVPATGLSLPGEVATDFLIPFINAATPDEKRLIVERKPELALHPAVAITFAYLSSDGAKHEPRRRRFFQWHLDLIRDARLYGIAKAFEIVNEYSKTVENVEDLPPIQENAPDEPDSDIDIYIADVPTDALDAIRELWKHFLPLITGNHSTNTHLDELAEAIEDQREVLLNIGTLRLLESRLDANDQDHIVPLIKMLFLCQRIGIEQAVATLGRIIRADFSAEHIDVLEGLISDFVKSSLEDRITWFSTNSTLISTGAVDRYFKLKIDRSVFHGDQFTANTIALAYATYRYARTFGMEQAHKHLESVTSALQAIVNAVLEDLDAFLNNESMPIFEQYSQIIATAEFQALIALEVSSRSGEEVEAKLLEALAQRLFKEPDWLMNED